jgi:hypothetical protein
MARAAPVTFMKLHAVIVVPTMKSRLEGMDPDALRFPSVPVRFLNLPNHARIHTSTTPFT